ncbi:hypothetical protein BGZ83_010798 [Gryganskiella cystojenkinii]|nr:hypothetical protein BGZ83_010798 [Gryganskiella cystojenkinii]
MPPYTHPIHTPTTPTADRGFLFGEPDQFQPQQQRSSSATPTPNLAEQRKEAKIAQRQRREQIILRLQQEQIDAQEKAKAEKRERQQAKLERKQQKKGAAATVTVDLDPGQHSSQQRYHLQDPQQYSHPHNKTHQQQRSLPIHPFSTQPEGLYHSSQHYHSSSYIEGGEGLSSESSTTSSSTASTIRHPPSSRSESDRMRSLSLKGTHKSMYDIRPWSADGNGDNPASPTVPSSFTYYYDQQRHYHQQQQQQHQYEHDQHPQDYHYHSGYDSDENSSSRSHGWDSLMDTLHSPTISSPPDGNWESFRGDDYQKQQQQNELDFKMMETMSSLTLTHSTSGNGKYLLILGANGRTGIELVRQGLERNYRVTAFVRDDKLLLADPSLRKNQNLLIVRGSPTSQADLERCVEGQDVVVNVIGARLMASDSTIGSHSQVVLNNAMKKHSVRRLIVVTSYGCLGLRNQLISTRKLFSKVFMTGILKDKVLQEDLIQRETEHLDWTIVRPITLKDGGLSEKYWVSSEALPTGSKVKVLTRKDLAHYILTIINHRQQYNTIRSIAGKPRPAKPNPFCPFERKKLELARQQELELERQMVEKF